MLQFNSMVLYYLFLTQICTLYIYINIFVLFKEEYNFLATLRLQISIVLINTFIYSHFIFAPSIQANHLVKQYKKQQIFILNLLFFVLIFYINLIILLFHWSLITFYQLDSTSYILPTVPLSFS